MRRPSTFFGAIVAAGGGVLAFAAARAAESSPRALALAAAAVVVMELVQVSGDDRSLDPLDAQPFSFASPVHLALVVVLGVWPAVLLAGLGVFLVDFFREAPRRAVAFNAAAFALATAVGGGAFALAGGTAGAIEMPGELPAFALLALVYLIANVVLVNAIVALHGGGPLLAELRDVLRTDHTSRVAEAALGLLLALCVLYEPWWLVMCVPLVVVVYQAHERLALLRRETARALETFANVVDERDPSTFHHSARVAQHVEELARAIGLSSSRVERLRWAGRLHDLGKITVDAQVLNKPGPLDAVERATMRRHARLSARLLRRFRLAAGEARAVEYHHERFDGGGYYGIEPEHVPLAAHILVIADSYDAMTSDRAYRRGLPVEEALAELERGAGSQFHPALVRAFVALRRGEDARATLSEADRRELLALRRPERTRSSRPGMVGHGMEPGALAAVVGLAATLGCLGAGLPLAALGTAAAALGGLVWGEAEQRRSHRLARDLAALAAAAADGPGAVSGLAGALSARGADWIGLIRWRSDELAAAIAREWRLHGGTAPSADALTSWLLRDAEDGHPVLANGPELGRGGWLMALPLAAAGGPATSFLVIAFSGARRRWVERALRAAQPRLAAVLDAANEGRRLPSLAVAS